MFRCGFGYDVHRLVSGRELILGGVKIPYSKGLSGHSDADVLIHSIIDALLGALALGDIGTFYPDNDLAYKDIDSRILLRKTYTLIREKGWKLNNLDAVICCQEPKLQPFINTMRANLALDLHCAIEQISLKATTEEGLGISGKGEGISAFCQLLLVKD
jgi:2-C-methyl-D-erythritol 2,4-cyclodiphosphate synthase